MRTRLSCLAIAAALLSGGALAAEGQVGSYFTSWSVEKEFRLKGFDQSGAAAGFTYLVYAFENVYQMADGGYRSTAALREANTSAPSSCKSV